MQLKTLFKRESAAGLILRDSKKVVILFQNCLMAHPLFRARRDSNLAGQATISTESVGLKMVV
jgi:hypothetical protein